MNDSAKILTEIARLRKSLRKPPATYNGPTHFPPLEVYQAAQAAGRHTPSNHRPRLKVPVFGRLPHMQESVYAKICDWLGLIPVEPKDATPGCPIGFVWKPDILGRSYDLDREIAEFRQVSPNVRLINETHFDDDKLVVQRLFLEQFSYALEIDPLQHKGSAVMKSRQNAKHDGQLVDCPIASADENYVYQAEIDNSVGGHLVEDLRVAVVHYTPILCYMKYRPLSSRFSNRNCYAQVAGVFDVFSSQEVIQISAFAKALGLEIGELDALRDGKSGRIYIVDANNTPSGPPNHIAVRDHDLAIRWLADAFVRAYLYDAECPRAESKGAA